MIRTNFIASILPIALGAIFMPTIAAAENGLETIESIAAYAAGPCFIHQSGDVNATLKTAKDATVLTGLKVAMEQGTSIVYGDFAGLNITLSSGIDDVSCAFRIPANMIDHAGFELMEETLDAAIKARYPDFIDSTNDDPSPHIDGHDWVTRTEANDALAITIQYTTERGVLFVSAAQKKYD